MGEMQLSELQSLPVVIDADTAARALGCSVRTVHRLAREHRIKAVKVGREWRINTQSVAEFMGVACNG